MAGDKLSLIKPPSHMAINNLTAYRTTQNGVNWLSGSFVVSHRCLGRAWQSTAGLGSWVAPQKARLSAQHGACSQCVLPLAPGQLLHMTDLSPSHYDSSLSLQATMDASRLSAASSVWVAAGPISGSGSPRMHDSWDTLTANLAATAGSAGAVAPLVPTVQRRSFSQWLTESPGEEPLIPAAFAGACVGGEGPARRLRTCAVLRCAVPRSVSGMPLVRHWRRLPYCILHSAAQQVWCTSWP